MSGEQAVHDPPKLQFASEGVGPLLERDYWANFRGVNKTPEEVLAHVLAQFPDFAPPETAAFCRSGKGHAPLVLGDEMAITIRLLGVCNVRVVHLDKCSVTLRTLEGHPEAGRITFGAFRDGKTLGFRIRSRTRQASLWTYIGFFFLGKQLQSRCWIRFIWRLAESLGGTVDGSVHVKTTKTRDRPSDWGDADTPTFSCDEAR